MLVARPTSCLRAERFALKSSEHQTNQHTHKRAHTPRALKRVSERLAARNNCHEGQHAHVITPCDNDKRAPVRAPQPCGPELDSSGPNNVLQQGGQSPPTQPTRPRAGIKRGNTACTRRARSPPLSPHKTCETLQRFGRAHMQHVPRSRASHPHRAASHPQVELGVGEQQRREAARQPPQPTPLHSLKSGTPTSGRVPSHHAPRPPGEHTQSVRLPSFGRAHIPPGHEHAP